LNDYQWHLRTVTLWDQDPTNLLYWSLCHRRQIFLTLICECGEYLLTIGWILSNLSSQTEVRPNSRIHGNSTAKVWWSSTKQTRLKYVTFSQTLFHSDPIDVLQYIDSINLISFRVRLQRHQKITWQVCFIPE
jgi:hypothetical protein